MRGTISDQDLMNYALNELQPEERLYLESMLAVSEECRHDIYEMIEMGQMLEKGFEAEEEQTQTVWLTKEQRDKLVQFPRSTPVWQRAAVIVGLAACSAFIVTHSSFWKMDDPAGRVAQVSTQMSRIVASAVNPAPVNFSTPLVNIASFSDDSSSWLPSAAEVLDPTVCTPPSWLETAQVSTAMDLTP